MSPQDGKLMRFLRESGEGEVYIGLERICHVKKEREGVYTLVSISGEEWSIQEPTMGQLEDIAGE